MLVYAKGTDHSLREPCRRLVTAVADGSIEVTTTVEVIQELAHVRARRTNAAEAAGLAREYAELLAPLMLATPEHLERGLAIFERVVSLGGKSPGRSLSASHRRRNRRRIDRPRGIASPPGRHHPG